MRKLRIGLVVQTFADGSTSKPYILNDLPSFIGHSYWDGICHLYDTQVEGRWNHDAHESTLRNIEWWKDMKGYEGHYQISDLGRVKSLKTLQTKILKGGINGRGYHTVNLSKKGKTQTHHVHVLVGVHFLGHVIGNGLIVDHVDNIPYNNQVWNLQLITQRENISKEKKGTSGYTGVSWDSSARKWKSKITINSKQKHLGLFDTEIEAADVYQKELNKIKYARK